MENGIRSWYNSRSSRGIKGQHPFFVIPTGAEESRAGLPAEKVESSPSTLLRIKKKKEERSHGNSRILLDLVESYKNFSK